MRGGGPRKTAQVEQDFQRRGCSHGRFARDRHPRVGGAVETAASQSCHMLADGEDVGHGLGSDRPKHVTVTKLYEEPKDFLFEEA